ncbi:MAG: GNAT family protein [Nanoarchaeota archaeon]
MKLQTKRLILRQVTEKDIPDVVKNINNLNVTKWLLVVPYPYKPKDAKKWIEGQKEKVKKKPKEDYTFGIELKSERAVIGGIGIHHINRYQGTATIGYWLGQDYWRNGYGSEALEVVLNLAFKRLKLRRLEAGVFAGNPSSERLLEKYGFQREGIKRKAVRSKANGKIHDEMIYALLRQDYKPR